MIEVSNAFKEAARAPVKGIRASIVCENDTYTSSDVLVSLSKEDVGFYFSTTTKSLSFKLLGTDYDLVGKNVTVTYEIQSGNSWDSCILGRFTIYEQTANLEKVDKDISEGGVNSFKDIHWIIWIYKIFNILAFLGTGTLGVLLTLAPISLPFFPLVGIGIAALSVLGVVKSVLHLFLDNKASHVKCYKAAKYFKCGIFILGGAALIALAFLPITTALAGIIGTPAILLKIACPVIGAFTFLKGVISCRYNYLRNECMLVVKELERIYGKSERGSITEKLSDWPRPKIDGDINFNSLDKAFSDYL